MSIQTERKRAPYNELKGWMVANGISQHDFALSLGTTDNYINKKLNGTGPDFKLSEARFLSIKYKFPVVLFLIFRFLYRNERG